MRILTVYVGLRWCKSLTLFFCSGFLLTCCADSKVNVFAEDPCRGLLLARLRFRSCGFGFERKYCLCLYLKQQSGFAKTLWACHKSSRFLNIWACVKPCSLLQCKSCCCCFKSHFWLSFTNGLPVVAIHRWRWKNVMPCYGGRLVWMSF